jgi:hypothetical protein
MASFDLPRLTELDEAAIAQFRANGFLIVERVLNEDRIGDINPGDFNEAVLRFAAGSLKSTSVPPLMADPILLQISVG